MHPLWPRWIRVNDTGLEIAHALDSGVSIDEVIGRLVARYDISQDQASRDVEYVHKKLKEERFLETGDRKSPHRRHLDSIYFHLTSRCNLACPHCYAACPDTAMDAPRDLATKDVLRVIDEAETEGAEGVFMSGGEPLLHPDFKKIVEHASPRLKINVLTNGILVDGEWASFLSEHDVEIQISIDGSTAELNDRIRGKGSFDKALRGIGFLQEAGLNDRLYLCTTLMKQNLTDFKEIVNLTERIGVPLVRFIPLRREGTACSEWDSLGSDRCIAEYAAFSEYADELRESRKCSIDVRCVLSGFYLTSNNKDGLWCPAAEQLVVDVDGDVFPCVLLMREEDRIGNLHEDSIAEICNSSEMRHFCHSLDNRRYTIEECEACLWRSLCQAGCMGLALDHTGTIWEKDHFCTYRKDAYRKAFDRLLLGKKPSGT